MRTQMGGRGRGSWSQVDERLWLGHITAQHGYAAEDQSGVPSHSREIIPAATGTLGTELRNALEGFRDTAGGEEQGRAGWRIAGQRR